MGVDCTLSVFKDDMCVRQYEVGRWYVFAPVFEEEERYDASTALACVNTRQENLSADLAYLRGFPEYRERLAFYAARLQDVREIILALSPGEEIEFITSH